MSVDYSQRYRPSQLEPFFPNEMIKMIVSVLATLAVIVALALLVPEGEEQPADPRNTPAHIKPEWYFLAVYQSLKLMPQSLLGVSGKLLGVLLQGVAFLALLLVPFWCRHSGHGRRLQAIITMGLFSFIALTLWGIWPEDSTGGLASPLELLRQHFILVVMIVLATVFFAVFMAWESHVIRRNWHG